jgi:hypothetical protein
MTGKGFLVRLLLSTVMGGFIGVIVGIPITLILRVVGVGMLLVFFVAIWEDEL